MLDNAGKIFLILPPNGFYIHLYVNFQIGRSSADPEKLQKDYEAAGIKCSCFRYHNSLDKFMNDATLIVSHAGAGSIIEALSTPSKPYLIVRSVLYLPVCSN